MTNKWIWAVAALLLLAGLIASLVYDQKLYVEALLVLALALIGTYVFRHDEESRILLLLIMAAAFSPMVFGDLLKEHVVTSYVADRESAEGAGYLLQGFAVKDKYQQYDRITSSRIPKDAPVYAEYRRNDSVRYVDVPEEFLDREAGEVLWTPARNADDGEKIVGLPVKMSGQNYVVAGFYHNKAGKGSYILRHKISDKDEITVGRRDFVVVYR